MTSNPASRASRLLAPMGLDDADDDIHAFAALGLRCRQHLECLADAGRGAEKDLQPAASPCCFQQGVGRGAPVALEPFIPHGPGLCDGFRPVFVARAVSVSPGNGSRREPRSRYGPAFWDRPRSFASEHEWPTADDAFHVHLDCPRRAAQAPDTPPQPRHPRPERGATVAAVSRASFSCPCRWIRPRAMSTSSPSKASIRPLRRSAVLSQAITSSIENGFRRH